MTELHNVFVAVVTDGGGRLLTIDGALPSWRTTGRARWSNAAYVTSELRERFGLDAFVLRPLFADRGDDGLGVWAHELALRAPARGRWIDARGAAALRDPRERRLATAALDDTARDEERRAPWSRPGWYDGALAWIDGELRGLGRERTGEPRQEHAWSISCVLRVPTNAGDVYFKALPPLFAHEPAVTATLARRHPELVTTVLAVDRERAWMVTDDLGGSPLHDVDDPRAWERAVGEYARIQFDWVGGVDELLACGCPDRTLAVLEREIDETLADPLLGELPRGLIPTEAARLPELAERLREACARLAAHDPPTTLEHGDLHPGNVRVRARGPAFFDWTDAAVSVPFFSLADGAPFFEFRGETADAERLRAVYAARWKRWTGDDVRRALGDAGFVGLFHWATGYRRIARAAEPVQAWELGSVFPWFVRKLLALAPA